MCNTAFTVFIRTMFLRGGWVPWDDFCDLPLIIWLVTWADGAIYLKLFGGTMCIMKIFKINSSNQWSQYFIFTMILNIHIRHRHPGVWFLQVNREEKVSGGPGFTVFTRTMFLRGGWVPWDDFCDLLLIIWGVTWADGSKELPGPPDTFSSRLLFILCSVDLDFA
jgi:hypothetical protein